MDSKLIGLIFTLLLMPANIAGGASLTASDVIEGRTAFFTPAKSIQCLFIDRQGGLETMVNRCGQCRLAKVSRKRPGQMAIYRVIHVPPGQRVQLSFKGRGQTRITEETFCANSKGENPRALLEDRAKCLKLRTMRRAGVVITNLCENCRSAVIERLDAGGETRRQVMVIKGRAYVPVSGDGAVSVRLISDKKCRPGDRPL